MLGGRDLAWPTSLDSRGLAGVFSSFAFAWRGISRPSDELSFFASRCRVPEEITSLSLSRTATASAASRSTSRSAIPRRRSTTPAVRRRSGLQHIAGTPPLCGVRSLIIIRPSLTTRPARLPPCAFPSASPTHRRLLQPAAEGLCPQLHLIRHGSQQALQQGGAGRP